MTIAMRIGTLAAALALAVVALVALGTAEASNLNEQVSGNFIDTSFDTNGDGLQANFWSGAARGNGNPSYEGVVEVAFGETGLCEEGEIEGTAVAYSIVRRYSNGDLLFSELIDGSLCFNPGTRLARLDINAEITGGTGSHSGASGTYSASYTIRGLIADVEQAIVHGAFYGSTSG